MKKLLFLLLGLVLLSAYAYFGIIKKEQSAELQQANDRVLFTNEKIKQIAITSGEYEIELTLEDGLWWVTKPVHYLADQEFMGKTLGIMEQAVPENSFAFAEDRFGLVPGRALFVFKYESGEQKRFIVGEKEAPQNNIYVLDKDNRQVHVVHNVWGQFLYFPISMFYSKNLPIPGFQVKAVSLSSGKKPVWAIKSTGLDEVELLLHGRTFQVKKAKLLWFFNQLRDFELKDLVFKPWTEGVAEKILRVETETGEMQFEFSESAQKINIPKFNVSGDYTSFSLKSLTSVLEKVTSSDKK